MRRPCNNCPWRKDAPAGYWDPQHFRDIWRNCQDDGANTMACHLSSKVPEERSRQLVCQGWVRVMGYDAIGVRLAVMRGTVSNEEVEDRYGPALFGSFAEMMDANGIVPPPRNRYTARDDDDDDNAQQTQ